MNGIEVGGCVFSIFAPRHLLFEDTGTRSHRYDYMASFKKRRRLRRKEMRCRKRSIWRNCCLLAL